MEDEGEELETDTQFSVFSHVVKSGAMHVSGAPVWCKRLSAGLLAKRLAVRTHPETYWKTSLAGDLLSKNPVEHSSLVTMSQNQFDGI